MFQQLSSQVNKTVTPTAGSSRAASAAATPDERGPRLTRARGPFGIRAACHGDRLVSVVSRSSPVSLVAALTFGIIGRKGPGRKVDW